MNGFKISALACSLFLAACAQLPGSTTPVDTTAAGGENKTGGTPKADEQLLRVDVLGSDGLPIKGMGCRLSNEYGFVAVQAGQPAVVKRSESDLEISCTAPGLPSTSAKLIARTVRGTSRSASTTNSNGTRVSGHIGIGSGGSHSGVGIGIGFPIIFGGERGAASDTQLHRYADWVQIPVGKYMLFDAAHNSQGKPVEGVEIVSPKKP